MDTETVVLIALAIFALVAIAAFQRFKRVKTGIRGPGGLGLDLQGSDEPPPDRPGVKLVRASSRGGAVIAEDATGRGADVSDVDAQGDVRVTSGPAVDPKGWPPA